jgi:hypothetical protein
MGVMERVRAVKKPDDWPFHFTSHAERGRLFSVTGRFTGVYMCFMISVRLMLSNSYKVSIALRSAC